MVEPDVTVIDYGMGNLLSVSRALEVCGATVEVTSDPGQILSAKRVVLPGVGAFADAMDALSRLELVKVIHDLVSRQIPLLGICLGMQLLLDTSEEFGHTQGLGMIPGRVIPLPSSTVDGLLMKVPHIGWNNLWPASEACGWKDSILEHIQPRDAVYFVHSFMAVPSSRDHCLAVCEYGGHKVPAVIARGRIVACQFHPEKSGEVGLMMLKRFCVS